MTNPDWNLQVKIGRGRTDTGAHHRAIEIARQLLAMAAGPIICIRSSSSTTLMISIANCNYPDRAFMMLVGASPCARPLTN